jgi:predicted RNA binding protein YcfA (HicA-like mRNA interferase family)
VSPSLPVVSGATVVASLEKIGFSQVGQRGSHVKLRDRSGTTVIVPLHRELARGTSSSVLRQADITISEFVALL